MKNGIFCKPAWTTLTQNLDVIDMRKNKAIDLYYKYRINPLKGNTEITLFAYPKMKITIYTVITFVQVFKKTLFWCSLS